jgi:hypothetical protein
LQSREKIRVLLRPAAAKKVERRDHDRDDGKNATADDHIQPIVPAHIDPPSQRS